MPQPLSITHLVRAGVEQGRARGIRGRLFPFVSCDSEGDQVSSSIYNDLAERFLSYPCVTVKAAGVVFLLPP